MFIIINNLNIVLNSITTFYIIELSQTYSYLMRFNINFLAIKFLKK